MQTSKGQSIEDESMRIIDAEAGDHGYGAAEWPVVRRVIHSTADFDFAGANAVKFGGDAIRAGTAALARGCHIVADVNGVAGLLSRQHTAGFGNGVVCRIADADVAAEAGRRGTTRAQASMRRSAAEIGGGVVAIGNAPTALLEVLAMAREGAARPALVVGVPVGFVSAAESKEELAASGLPFVTNRGRKGGSPAAAAIVNALLRLARDGLPS